MDKQEQKVLAVAWEKSHNIIRDIRDLAEINTFLAYGVIRSAETAVDLIAVYNAYKQAEKKDEPETA